MIYPISIGLLEYAKTRLSSSVEHFPDVLFFNDPSGTTFRGLSRMLTGIIVVRKAQHRASFPPIPPVSRALQSGGGGKGGSEAG